jgi:hypothetical protein
MKKIINKIRILQEILKVKSLPEKYPDIQDENFWKCYAVCKDYSMTTVERMYSLYNAVHNVLNNNIGGDFVECGVWRGGSAMMIALILKEQKIKERKIYLYDTFEGMSEPTEKDLAHTGEKAEFLLKQNEHNKEESVWCLADLADVKRNMALTGIESDQMIFVKGKVEDTIPNTIPEQIALLRLDTDWYESTKHELIHLYPKLIKKGILIIDDYGHWKGCKEAVDEYFAQHKIHLMLNRIDYTGRLAVKTGV